MARILHDIIYNPDPTSARVMFHHTNPNGRNIVFTAAHNMLVGGKTLSVLGGIATTADYTFRIGINDANLDDANDNGWGAYSSIPWSTFLSSTLVIGQRVRVEFNGTFDNTDIAAYLDYPTEFTPVYPFGMTMSTKGAKAASDVMLYTGINTNFTTSPSINPLFALTEKRTAAEITANSDLTDYVSGITEWQPPNDTTANHIFIPYLRTNATLTTITASTASPTVQLSAFATPLSNAEYPVKGNGTTAMALRGDSINDLLYVPAGPTGADLLYPSNMSVGEERSFTWLGVQNSIGNYNVISNTISEISRELGSSNFASLYLNSRLLYRFENTGGNAPRYVTFTYRRKALTGTATEMYDVEMYVNSRFIPSTTITGSVSANTYQFGGVRFNLGMFNATPDSTFSNLFRTRRLSFVSVHNKVLTKEKIRRIHLGADIMSEIPAIYYYDLTNLVVDGVNRTIPNLGTGTIDDARLENSNNESDIVPLFT